MGRDDLQVSGGVGGVAARLDDLRTHARRSDAIGDVLGGVAATLAASAADGDLLASAVLSPGTAARAEAALADVAARVGVAAGRAEAVAAGLRTVAEAFEAADRTAAIATDGVQAGAGLATLLGGVGGTLVAAPYLYAGNLGAEATGAVGTGLDQGWDAGWERLRTAGGDAGTATLDDVGGFWSQAMLRMPGITDAVVEGLGVTGSLVAGRPLDYEETIVGVLVAGSLLGAFDDTRPIEVVPASLDDHSRRDRRLVRVPRSVSDLFLNQQSLMGPAGDDREGSRLRVVQVGTAEEPAWIVHVPGTQEWAPASGGDPSDATTNLHLTGPEDAALLDAVDRAMAQAGVGDGEPIMLVGHSQGGIAAAAYAAQAAARGDNVTHVVTGGSPVAHIDVPDHVRVLSLEHTDDPVPRLDGDPNPAGANWTTVRRDVTLQPDERSVMRPHGVDLYAATGAEVDRTDDPSVAAYRDSAAHFLAGSHLDVDRAISDFVIRRQDTP